jgi:hypothetical protein
MRNKKPKISVAAKKTPGESLKPDRDTKIKKMVVDIFGCCKGRIEIVGDILAPLVPIKAWEALK